MSPLRPTLQQLAGAAGVVGNVDQQEQRAEDDHGHHEADDRADHHAPNRLGAGTADVHRPLIAAARAGNDDDEEADVADDFHTSDDEQLHDRRLPVPPVAKLVFLARAARAGLVAPDLAPGFR